LFVGARISLDHREPRVVCAACRRPASVCYCRHVTKVTTRTRIVLLQHPRERDMPIGTARMATLCLPNAELHEGVTWDDATLERVLGGDAAPAVLLYPGEGAIDVLRQPPSGPVTLVVVDGTWWQARKIVRKNPRLAALPRYAFSPPRPSEYRIRREPAETCVSTIEALAHVLGVLEGDVPRFEALLHPFRAMIDAQIACERALRGAGARHAAHAEKKRTKQRASRVPPLLAAPVTGSSDLVCVAGEANAWPYRSREVGEAYDDELVHWAACRMSTGEVFERVVAPARPLAPRTTSYVELDGPELRAGATPGDLFRGWRGFVRDTDVICYWGHYAPALFVASGGYLPDRRVDLRAAARDFERARVGTLEEHLGRVGLAAGPPLAPGRAGRRLAQIAAVTRRFVDLAARERV
jgi:DTW domain-containing protein YfiP